MSESVYEAAGGELGMLLLARAWHERVMLDEVVAHAFSHGFAPDHDERLAAYWGEALGGPATYTERYGDETAVVRIHSGNGPHEEMNERAIACFDLALADVGIGEDDPVHRVLHDYFAWTTPYIGRFEVSADDVPEGLAVPQWSWDGPVDPWAGAPPAVARDTDRVDAEGADTRGSIAHQATQAAETPEDHDGAPAAGPARLRLREIVERVLIARDADRLPEYCDPDCVLITDGRPQDLARLAEHVARTDVTYAVEYDEQAWVETADRLGARLWITTARRGQAQSRTEVVLLTRLRGGRLYRLWVVTRPDWSAD